MKIRRAHLDEIAQHLRKGYPYEACGVLLGRGHSVEKVALMENRETEQPRIRYQIAPEDLLRLQRSAREEQLEIIGFFHSHPDHPARPSETDRRIAAEGLSDGVFHMVIGVEKGERIQNSAWVFRDARQAFEEEPLEIEER